MSNAASRNDEVSGRGAAERHLAAARAWRTWAIIVVLTAGLSVWTYFYCKETLRQRATQIELRWGVGGSEASVGLLGQIDQIAVRIGFVMLIGAVTCFA